MKSNKITNSEFSIDPTVNVHESSYVDDPVAIDEGTAIWHFCHVMTGSRIGKNCRIGQNVVIGPRAIIGNGVKIQNNVSVYEGVVLEDDVFCGPSMVFTNVQTPRSAFPRNRPEDNLPTIVKRGASIGANATIVCGCTIGENALIGAGSVVTRDVSPHAVVYGNPARHHGWACSCGIVLETTQSKEVSCNDCGRSYQISEQSCVPIEKKSLLDGTDLFHQSKVIPVCDVRLQYEELQDEIQNEISKVAAHGQYILGPNVKSFEKEIAEFSQCNHAVGVGNGSDALHLALRALEVGPGDEVITTPFTFIATTEAILMVGATPVFVDIDPSTFNMDHRLIEAAITERTKVILPVHLYGLPCEMDSIMDIASKYKLRVVEDCAQALGAKYHGQPVGTFGDAGCLSFFPSKNLGCLGDGGMVITNDGDVFERVEMLRRHGGRVKYYHEELGVNSRLDEIQAAVLRVKLRYLDRWNAERIQIAEMYNQGLQAQSNILNHFECEAGKHQSSPSTTATISLPAALPSDVTHVYHQYTMRVSDRDIFVKDIRAKGVSTGIYYPVPLHLQQVHANLNYNVGDLPRAEECAASVVSLPMYPGLGNQAVQQILREIHSWISSRLHTAVDSCAA